MNNSNYLIDINYSRLIMKYGSSYFTNLSLNPLLLNSYSETLKGPKIYLIDHWEEENFITFVWKYRNKLNDIPQTEGQTRGVNEEVRIFLFVNYFPT